MAKKKIGGRLSAREKRIVNGLLNRKWRNQDIQFQINIGRPDTINSARITEVKQNNNQKPAKENEIDQFLAVQKEHDLKTGLNPYHHPRLIAGREAMMAAVQAFNNPMVKFRAKNFAVLANIAWTNVLHEYYERKGVGIWQGDQTLALSQMIKRPDCPLEKPEKENIKALQKIRDLVEHKYWIEADSEFISIFQANCLNFDDFLSTNFENQTALSNEMGLALQFANMNFGQIATLNQYALPHEITALSDELYDGPSDAIKDSTKYAFNVVYALTAASKGQAHFQFLGPESHEGQEIHNILVKNVPAPDMYPHMPGGVCKKVEQATRQRFNMHDHTTAWKNHGVRPAWSSSAPDTTNSEFCHYSVAHRNYLYNDKWVKKLVDEVNAKKT